MQRLQFGDFEINLASRELLKRGARVPLRGPRLVTREELRHRLWPDDVFVDFDNNLNSAVARLREVLGDSVHHPRFIETLPKMGYRFIGNASSAWALLKRRGGRACWSSLSRISLPIPTRSISAMP